MSPDALSPYAIPAVNHNKIAFLIHGHIRRGAEIARVNGGFRTRCSRVVEHLKLDVTTLTPDDHKISNGAHGNRRILLDTLVCLINPLFGGVHGRAVGVVASVKYAIRITCALALPHDDKVAGCVHVNRRILLGIGRRRIDTELTAQGSPRAIEPPGIHVL